MKIELKIDEFVRNKQNWYLILEGTEDEELISEPPICQNCKGILITPFYVCETNNWRWVCKICQFSNKPICMHEPTFLKKDDHAHICIRKLIKQNES